MTKLARLIYRILTHPLLVIVFIFLAIFWDKIPTSSLTDEISPVGLWYLYIVIMIRVYRKTRSIKKNLFRLLYLISLALIFLGIPSYIFYRYPSYYHIGIDGVVTVFGMSLLSLPLLWTILHLRLIGKTFLRALIWPYKSKGNFGRSILALLVLLYFASLEFRLQHLFAETGGYSQLLCSEEVTKFQLKNSVVRIVGSYGEGSGFFVTSKTVMTNFHVIDGEISPKIIFPDGGFVTPKEIQVYKEGDLALLKLKEEFPRLVLNFLAEDVSANETLLAFGYPLGTDIKGEATALKGTFLNYRNLKGEEVEYIQTSIPLVQGMSGGPAVTRCGSVVGVNTLGVSGMSFLIKMNDPNNDYYSRFTVSDQTKVKLDPSKSPEEAVIAYYTYLKVRDMKSGFDLLSQKYLEKTNFDEWTARFPDVIDVQVYQTRTVEGVKDTVFVKFATRNWVNNDTEVHYYEGTWQTILEGGKYKMLRSKIIEVLSPPYSWFYE